MTTLTKIAQYTRDTMKYGMIVLVLLVIAAISWKQLSAYLASRKPALPPAPMTTFGKLPPINFPKEAARPQVLTLQTIQGAPPVVPPIERVYSVHAGKPDLLGGQRAQQFAQKLEFSSPPVKKEAGKYTFTDPDYPARSLIYNSFSNNFRLNYDLNKDSSPLEGNALPLDINRVINEAETLLTSLNKLHPSITGSKRFVSYLRFEQNTFVTTDNKLQAQLVRVDFMPAPLDQVEIKTPFPNRSSVFIIFSGRRRQQERIVLLNYELFPPDKSVIATYPLKSSQSAWEELRAGGGYIANIGVNNVKEAIVRDAYLAFYAPAEAHKYLQPIFVFTGDRGFEAYVSAVRPEWIQ